MAIYGSNADVLQFRGRSKDWTQQELAEFYRVENALSQSGIRVLSERGLSDEGDPWFIFLRENDHEPLVHFARIDGYYYIASAAYDGVAKGKNFREMILDLLSRHRLNSEVISKKSNVFWHPAALLITLVGVAFFKVPTSAKAEEDHSDEQLHEKNLALSLTKTKITAGYRANNESRVSSQNQVDGSWSVEMTNALLSAIAFLPLMGTAADAQGTLASQAPTQHDLNTSQNDFAALTTKLSTHSQPTLLSLDSSSQELQSSAALITSAINLPSADTQFSDALNIIDVLNQISAAKLANAPSLSTIIKTSASGNYLSNVNFDYNHAEEAGALAYTRSSANSENGASKYSFSAPNTNEKYQKDIGSDATKSTIETSHASKIQLTDFSTQTVPVELQEINYKVSLTALVGSAVTVINQLNSTYHFSDFLENSFGSKVDANTTASLNTAPNSVDATVKITSPIVAKNYSVSSNENSPKATDTTSAPAPQNTYEIINITNQLNGDQVEGLLNKFMQSFANAHFAPSSSNEFVFQTDASLNTQSPLEQIIISFNDGSHINLIGQKGEIAQFISLG